MIRYLLQAAIAAGLGSYDDEGLRPQAENTDDFSQLVSWALPGRQQSRDHSLHTDSVLGSPNLSADDFVSEPGTTEATSQRLISRFSDRQRRKDFHQSII